MDPTIGNESVETAVQSMINTLGYSCCVVDAGVLGDLGPAPIKLSSDLACGIASRREDRDRFVNAKFLWSG